MAQPAPLPEEDNVPGNADSAPPGREHLKVLEGGGDTTEPDRSWYKPEGSQNAKNQDELADAESSASQTSAENTHENQVGSGYNPYGKLNKNNKRSARKWRFTKRRALFGGGLIGTIVAMFLFFVGSGPLQFVHIAQLLEQFHFSAQEDQSDDRFVKLARYIKYAPKGEAERTRLGVFQNKIADKIEARMNKVGIQSSYSDTFGFGDGYVINPDKLSTSDFENLKGKSDTEIKKYFRDNFNVEVKTMLPNGQKVPKGSFFVDSTNMGYFENRRFIQAMLKTSKYSRISSSVGARIMGKRAGVTWHPIKKLDNKILKTAEARYTQWKKNQITEIEKGANADLAAKSQPGDEKTKGEADSAASEGNSVASDGEDTGNKVNSGDTNAIADFQDRLSVKVTLGGAAAAGVLCMAKGIDQNAASIKQSQVVLPLIRQGMQAITLGNQVMSLQDVDREQLGFFAKQLDGKDSRGDKTSWIQAQSIQAELGNKPSGNIGKPNETLTTITKGSPFQSLNEGTVGTILGPVCSAPGGVVLTIVSFFGGPVSALAGTVVSSIASGPIMNTMAHWLAGKAVDPLPVGADLGNAINFGARLAANAQAVSAGGRELSDQESTQLASIQSQWSRQDFQDHSLAYQLFNPYDQRSAISKVIDRQSSDINQDFSHMASFLTNFKNTFSSLASIFTPPCKCCHCRTIQLWFP